MSFKDRDYFKVKLEPQDDESLWLKCKACSELIFKKRVRENNNICPKCNEYFFLTARERIESLVDKNSFTDISKPIVAADPLDFVDSKPYSKRIEEAQLTTDLADAIILGHAAINSKSVIIAVMEFRFVGGSMGSVMGEQICHGMEEASRLNWPFILISASGGARMQEGIFSLFQMAKTSAVRAKLAENKIPFISIMTYPTTGGVASSIASLGDVIIAEKGALIGFAGRRVIQNTTGEELPDTFQTDSFALSHGSVDQVVARENLRNELSRILSFFNAVERK